MDQNCDFQFIVFCVVCMLSMLRKVLVCMYGKSLIAH